MEILAKNGDIFHANTGQDGTSLPKTHHVQAIKPILIQYCFKTKNVFLKIIFLTLILLHIFFIKKKFSYI